MGHWGFPKYVTVAQKKAKAEKRLKKLRKKIPDIQPVTLETKTLARTWWGKSWNKNLERYADYENRIGRGRSYVRHGAVLDLRIAKGVVRSLVSGSDSKPYEIVINIKALNKTQWQEIQKECAGRLKSLQILLAGKFPEGLQNIFFDEKKGLFPGPKDISFDCSCPDWASMCKHVAATLYGVGARLDEDPSLFFTLRGVDSKDIIDKAVEDTADKLLEKSKKKSSKVLADDNLSDIFGIDMDIKPDFGEKKEANISSGNIGKRKKTTVAKPKTRVRSTKPSGTKTATGQVVELLSTSSTGLTIQELVEQTGYSKTKLYGIVHRLKKQGAIQKRSHRVYEKVSA